MANDGITPLVSFCDDGSDRARRFTISAQPSSANIATIPALERQGSIQKTSRNNSINDNDVMLFIAKGSHPRNTPLKLNHDYITSSNESSRGNSRVASPVSPGHGRQHQYFDKSPSPPNGKSEKEREGIERGCGAGVLSSGIPWASPRSLSSSWSPRLLPIFSRASRFVMTSRFGETKMNGPITTWRPPLPPPPLHKQKKTKIRLKK